MALLSPAPTAPRWGLILPGMNSVTKSDLLCTHKGAPGWHPHCLIYTTWHTSLQKPSPRVWQPFHSMPSILVHAAWTHLSMKGSAEGSQGTLADLRTSPKVCPWGRCFQTNSSCYLVSPHPSLVLPQGFQVPVLDIHAASYGAKNVPEAQEMRLPMRNPIHAATLLSAPQHPVCVPGQADAAKPLSPGRSEKSVGFPVLPKAQQLQGQLDFHIKRIRGKCLFLFTWRL